MKKYILWGLACAASFGVGYETAKFQYKKKVQKALEKLNNSGKDKDSQPVSYSHSSADTSSKQEKEEEYEKSSIDFEELKKQQQNKFAYSKLRNQYENGNMDPSVVQKDLPTHFYNFRKCTIDEAREYIGGIVVYTYYKGDDILADDEMHQIPKENLGGLETFNIISQTDGEQFFINDDIGRAIDFIVTDDSYVAECNIRNLSPDIQGD